MEILYKHIEDAGIEVNCVMGLSEREHNEIRETEFLDIERTDSGLFGLYHSDGSPALNGTSSGGFLRRGDVRAEKLRRLYGEV
jgi:hypothetical protein